MKGGAGARSLRSLAPTTATLLYGYAVTLFGVIAWCTFVGVRLRRRRVKYFFFLYFPFFFGWRVRAPPVVFSVSLRSRSFWLPCPPPFGGLRPGRARVCDRGALSFRPRLSLVGGVSFGGWGSLSLSLRFCRWGFSLSRFIGGWRFFGGSRALRSRGGGYAGWPSPFVYNGTAMAAAVATRPPCRTATQVSQSTSVNKTTAQCFTADAGSLPLCSSLGAPSGRLCSRRRSLAVALLRARFALLASPFSRRSHPRSPRFPSVGCGPRFVPLAPRARRRRLSSSSAPIRRPLGVGSPPFGGTSAVGLPRPPPGRGFALCTLATLPLPLSCCRVVLSGLCLVGAASALSPVTGSRDAPRPRFSALGRIERPRSAARF